MIDAANDAVLVEAVAEDYVRRLGRDAVAYLRQQQSSSEGLTAHAWSDIADAAERLLQGDRG